MVTEEFIENLALFGFADDAGATPGAYEVVLATNPAGSLNRGSTWADVEEMVGDGYAPPPATNWAKVAEDAVRCECGAFVNYGDVPWPPATYSVIKGYFGGQPTLCWFSQITPAVVVDPNDSVTFPDGIEFSIKDRG